MVYLKYVPSLDTHFPHLSGKLWMPYQKTRACFEVIQSISPFSSSPYLLKCFKKCAWDIDENKPWSEGAKFGGGGVWRVSKSSQTNIKVVSMAVCEGVREVVVQQHIFFRSCSTFWSPLDQCMFKLIISWR